MLKIHSIRFKESENNYLYSSKTEIKKKNSPFSLYLVFIFTKENKAKYWKTTGSK